MPCNLAVRVAGCEEREQVGNLDREALVAIGAPQGDQREGSRLLRVVQAFGRRELHRLVRRYVLAQLIAGDDNEQAADQQEHRTGLGRGSERRAVRARALEQPPHGDAEDERTARHEGAGDDVGEGEDDRWVGQDREEVLELGPPRRGVYGVPHGLLHPGVCRQDDVGREGGRDGHDPDRREVDAPGQLVPTEDPDPQEGRLQEEGEQPFDGQRRSEDVSHEPAVITPVHAELELLDDARDHAHGEVDQEQLAVKAGQSEVLGVAGPEPGRLKARHDEGQRDREWDE